MLVAASLSVLLMEKRRLHEANDRREMLLGVAWVRRSVCTEEGKHVKVKKVESFACESECQAFSAERNNQPALVHLQPSHAFYPAAH